MTRFVLLSGPSCVGKGPLISTIRAFHKKVKFGSVNVIKSFESRPGGKLRPTDNENDFFSADEIKSWQGNPRYIVGDCRGYPQAIDLDSVAAAREQNDVVFLEVYYTLGQQVREHKQLQDDHDLQTFSVFLSPVSKQEIEDLKKQGANLPQFLTELMMSNQLARGRFMGDPLTPDFIRKSLARAQDTYDELSTAHLFSGVLVNHDAEGSPNWCSSPEGEFFAKPIGDAGRVTERFAAILRGGTPEFDVSPGLRI